MASDDVTFVCILVGSVVLSALLRLCPSHWRADAAAVSGAAAILGACGPWNALHPLTAVALALLVRWIVPSRWREGTAFVVAFGHLASLRVLPTPPGGPTNAAMLLLTLRLAAGGPAPRSSFELMRYASCYQGLFTGPYYSYEVWDAAMREPQRSPSAYALVRALLAAVGATAVWRVIAVVLPYRAVWEGGSEMGLALIQRICYFYASSYQFRWRFYACWLIMAVSGQLAGFSAEHSSNVNVAACELATSPSGLIGGWNTSVQAWLKMNVYQQLPRRTPRLVRQLATFAVSAFWHGVHPGYYLCFLGVFAMIGAEQVVRAAWFGAAPSGPTQARSSRLAKAIGCHFWTMGCFSFFGGAFNLLRWSEILALWRSIGFYGIFLNALAVVLALLKLAQRKMERTPKVA
jgi:lysophospholipid acyltransferase 7